MPDWHPEDIKAKVRKSGETLTSLAAAVGLDPRSLSNVLVEPHIAAEQVLADFLNVAPHVIWPSRYDAAGERLSPQPAANYVRRPRFQAAEARA